MEGSAIMEDLTDCLVILGAQQVRAGIWVYVKGFVELQFRIHSSQRTKILLHLPSTPIIEHSSSLVFGPYPAFLNPPVCAPFGPIISLLIRAGRHQQT
jgi:hypothetical protein